MEDIRFNSIKNRTKNKMKFNLFLLFLKKHWLKIILIILFILIIIFPNILGVLLGSWWNNFATSFLSKITF
jgi:hypothetical protein